MPVITRIIVGLGNPGKQYAITRHNAGALVLAQLGTHLGLSSKKMLSDLVEAAETHLDPTGIQEAVSASSDDKSTKTRVVLVRPQTYMNVSGIAVARALQHYDVKPENLLVLHDEIDLPFGATRFKQGGGHRGHNGLRNIVAKIGRDFDRLRLGVGRPEQREDVAAYVLSPFTKSEQEKLQGMLDEAQDICMAWLNRSLDKPT